MNLRKRMLNDLDREIEEHIALETQDNIDRGMSPEEARYAALRKFGSVVRAKEETRAVWISVWLEELVQDIRFGLRTFRKSPVFVTVAILTLALGIGANTAIFSLIDAVMLKSLPAEDPSQLFLVRWNARNAPNLHGYMSSGDCPSDLRFGAKNPSGCSFSEPMFREFEQAKVFPGIGGFANAGTLALTGHGPATTVTGQMLSGDFFRTMGIKAAAGRLLTASDDTVSAPPVAVLNYAYWQSAFGGSQDVIGSTIELNSVPFTIVGVAEPRFNGITPGSDYDVWLTLSNDHLIGQSSLFAQTDRRNDAQQWWLAVVARVAPGTSPAQAQAVLTGLFRNGTLHGDQPLFNSGEAPAKPQPIIHGQLRRPDPGSRPSGSPNALVRLKPLQPPSAPGPTTAIPQADNPEITLVSAQEGLGGIRSNFSNPLYVMMMAVGIILLIACANVAGLMLARASARRKEMAVRLALGASRVRVVRQLLTESVMLSAFGGILGVLVAYWGARSIVAFVSHNSRSEGFGFHVSIDLRILVFTLAISVFSGILFGLAPALRSVRASVAPALKEGEASSNAPKRRGARWFNINNTLVVSQMALAMVLLVGAGLLVRTLQNLRNIDVGFDSHNILIFSLNPELAGYKHAQVNSFYRDLQGRFTETPGVRSASYSMMPLLSGGMMMTAFHWPGTPQEKMSESDVLHVGPNFFETMHISLLQGRNFGTSDFAAASASLTPGSNKVRTPVIVNRAFVQKYLDQENPIGKQFGEFAGDGFRPPSPGYEIVGVVNDTKYGNLRRAVSPMMFTPQTSGAAAFELRTAADPQAVLPAIRKVMAEVNANMPLFNVQTESQQIDRILFQERLVARLATLFSILALVLASIGLYGLLSYEVSRRRREIGIRMALGAQTGDVMRLVVKQGIALAVVGAVLGIGAAIAAARYLSSMLYEVRGHDPGTVIAVALLLVVVSLVASVLPAKRATRVDPMVTLRYE